MAKDDGIIVLRYFLSILPISIDSTVRRPSFFQRYNDDNGAFYFLGRNAALLSIFSVFLV